MLRQITEFIAVLACGLFAGGAVYVSLVEHPARLECGVEIAAIEFYPSYHRGTILQATLAAVGLISSIEHGSPGRHSGGSLAVSCSVVSFR
jgi:hypothetical protein